MTSKEMEIDSPSGSGCVLKVKVRKSFSQLAEYCASHATNMNGEAMREAIFTNMAARTPTPRELSREVGFCFRQRQNKKVNTGHLIISPSVPFRSEKDLELAISITLNTHDLQDTPWAAFYHGQKREKHPHSHIAFSLIRFDGSVVNMDHSYRKNEQAARAIEAAFPYLGRLSVRPKSDRPRNNDPAHAAMRREKRIQKRKEKENGRQQRYFEHAPAEPHRGKPGKLSENRLHALSECRVAHHGIPESQGVLQADALPGRRKPDCVRWQSGNSIELIAINSKKGSKANMTAQAKIKDLETQVRAALARDDVTDLDSFREAVREEAGGAADVEFWRGPAGDVAGWSLLLAGGTKIKGSELSRSLSFAKVAAALDESARRRRMAGRQVEATAEAVAGTGEVLAAAGQTVRTAASNVVSLGLGAQPRAIVKPTRPAPGAKPYAIQPQGLQIPGYVAARGACLDPDRGIHMWTYARAGSEGETVFSDDGESLQLHGEALGDPLAIDAFVQAARARFGSSLTLTMGGAHSAHPNFLAMLAASASERGVEIINARTGLPIPATQRPEEPSPMPEAEQQGLDFLSFGSGSDPAASAAPVAAAAGQGEAPAAPASGDQQQKDSLVVPANDLAGRRAAAQKVLAMASEQAKTASGGAPGHRLGVLPRDPKVSAQELRALLAEAESWLPVQEWAAVTAERQRQDRWALEGDGRDPEHLVLSRANLRGDPLAVAASEAQQRLAHAEACAAVARRERDQRSALQKGVELVSGRSKEREDEIDRLEGLEREARAEAARARAAFFAQEDTKKTVQDTAELAETHALESRAFSAVELLLGLLARFIKALTGMLAQAEAREAEQDRERERREDRQRHAEALAAGDPAAMARHDREQKELQERHAREQFSFERGR